MAHVNEDFFSDASAVANEYVLGLLTYEERLACQHRMSTDRAFRLEVEKYEALFSPMNDEIEPHSPPKNLLKGINNKLFTAPKPSVWKSLFVWRGLSAACASVALAAVLVPTYLNFSATPNAQLIASLEAEGSETRYLALYDPANGTLKLRALSNEHEDDKSHELWLIQGSGAPKSLGLVEHKNISISIGELDRKIDENLTFAISLEAAGGSTSEGPTGPVIAAGQALEL